MRLLPSGRHQRADPAVGGLPLLGGWKRTASGDANQRGMEGVRFYTKVRGTMSLTTSLET
jgi:hypothetical protein